MFNEIKLDINQQKGLNDNLNLKIINLSLRIEYSFFNNKFTLIDLLLQIIDNKVDEINFKI
jgi:hypothetical protein